MIFYRFDIIFFKKKNIIQNIIPQMKPFINNAKKNILLFLNSFTSIGKFSKYLSRE
jgi:hypothetical protein